MNALDEARKLLPRLALELENVYLLENPPTWPRPMHTTAYCIRGRHLGLRRHLEETGRWRGWWPAVLFVNPPTDFADFFGLAIHEIAHACPIRQLPDVRLTESDRAQQQRKIDAFLSTDPSQRPSDLLLAPPFSGHGLPWIRRCLHLFDRTRWAGVAVLWPAIDCAGLNYCLSQPQQYFQELRGETFELRGLDFDSIERIEPPQGFVELFARDVARWLDGQDLDELDQEAAA